MAFPDFTEKVDIVELSTNSVLRELCGNVAFIVPDKSNLTADENYIKTEVKKKYNLFLFSSVDSGNIDFSNFNVIILSPGLTLTDLDELKYLEKPVITLDATHPNQLLSMTTNAGTHTTNETQIDLQTTEQQIISGADITATGYTTVYSASDSLTGVTLAGVGGIINLALKPATAYSCLCVLEKGATNADGDVNADIRIFFGMLSGAKLNSTGLNLLLQSILYSGCMASNVSQSTYQLIKQLQTIEYKVASTGVFPLGNMYFVSISGSDTNDGTSWAKAKLTIDAAIALATDDNNDYIFVGPGSYNEDDAAAGVTVDKSTVHLIGAGIDSAHSADTTDVVNDNIGATAVFTVTAVNTELAGFRIKETTTTVEGIYVDANRNWIHDNLLNAAMENGIHLDGTSYCLVEHNSIGGITNDGIELSGAAQNNTIRYNEIFGTGDNGIHVNDNDADGNFVYRNVINGNNGTTDVGIQVTRGDENIIFKNTIAGCTSPTGDTGSNNIWVDNSVDKITGSFNILVADGTIVTDKLPDIDLPTTGRFAVRFDVNTLIVNEAGKTVTFYVYVKIDGTNYRVASHKNFLAGTDTDHPLLEFESEGGDARIKIASQMDTVAGGTRAIPYKIVPLS